jgi:toxin YoeB
MNKLFTENGWEDYVFWQTEDRKTLRKINLLLNDIERNGNEGIGKPEPLRGNLSGFWSRRINDKDRLIYKVDQNNIYILACRYHYNKK